MESIFLIVVGKLSISLIDVLYVGRVGVLDGMEWIDGGTNML